MDARCLLEWKRILGDRLWVTRIPIAAATLSGDDHRRLDPKIVMRNLRRKCCDHRLRFAQNMGSNPAGTERLCAAERIG
jgi:hypothetical protein